MRILKHSKTIEGQAKHGDELDTADADSIVFFGIPGCGKSSLINALCNSRSRLFKRSEGEGRGQRWHEIEIGPSPGLIAAQRFEIESSHSICLCLMWQS